MEIKLLFQSLNAPPQLTDLKQPVANFADVEKMTFCVIEAGMASGQPSVMIIVEDDQCSVVLQTSLDKLVAAAYGLMGIAEREWQWKNPEGSFTLLPPSKEKQKELLEAIKKELEEWEEVEKNNE